MHNFVVYKCNVYACASVSTWFLCMGDRGNIFVFEIQHFYLVLALLKCIVYNTLITYKATILDMIKEAMAMSFKI